MEAKPANYQLPVHPAADLFPLMTESEFRQLVESIRDRGLIEPIVICAGAVLDGRNRLRACEEAGVEPHFIEWDGTGGSPTAYAVTRNLNRRHLTTSQQATIGVAMLPLLREEARKRQRDLAHAGRKNSLLRAKSPEANLGRARALAAKAVGIGEKTIDEAAAVQRDDPEAFERLRKGETRVHTEYRRLITAAADRERLNAPDGHRWRPFTRPHATRFRHSMDSVRASVRAITALNPTYIVFSTPRDEAARKLRQIETVVQDLNRFAQALADAIKHSPEANGQNDE